ncbi:uncharacterized protein [Epargyreus clarus]|uniref:uncharacterized protein n=1 Tax=Epargyreus clarus TaxID=520877 RepID=UPI003C2ACC05
MSALKNKLQELQTIISKMHLDVFCVIGLPEFGVQWKDVSRAVRNARLPMTPTSVARIIYRHVAKALPEDEVDEIVARLRLKLIATQCRTWHVINLLEPTSDEPLNVLIRALPSRVMQALRSAKVGRGMRPEVQVVKLEDLIYISVQLVSMSKQGSVLYVATPPGEPVALVSSVRSSGLLKPLVQGLGYQKYEDASLHGRDVASLLRIHNQGSTGRAEHLAGLPEYQPVPSVTSSGVDYTNRSYDEQYVKAIVGPDPPLLTSLTVNIAKPFFDSHRLDKKMKIKFHLRSEDIAKTLTTWAEKGALAPTSDLFQIFHKIKSNNITYDVDDVE